MLGQKYDKTVLEVRRMCWWLRVCCYVRFCGTAPKVLGYFENVGRLYSVNLQSQRSRAVRAWHVLSLYILRCGGVTFGCRQLATAYVLLVQIMCDKPTSNWTAGFDHTMRRDQLFLTCCFGECPESVSNWRQLYWRKRRILRKKMPTIIPGSSRFLHKEIVSKESVLSHES